MGVNKELTNEVKILERMGIIKFDSIKKIWVRT